jgi:Ca2+-binding RTX toxin-like protein
VNRIVARIAPTLAIAALGCALVPSALASTASIQNTNRVAVSGTGSEQNQIQVSYDSILDLYTVTDAAGVTASGMTCTQVDPQTVTCPGAGITNVRVTSATGNDTIAVAPAGWPATIETDLEGGNGNDRITGAGAMDAVNGGGGTDTVDGGPGADDVRGGSGIDIGSYANRTTPLTITVGAGNDNDGNEVDQTGANRDTVRGDIETVLAGSAADIIVGDSSSGETLFGGDGNDSIFGGRGRDLLLGFLGSDFLSGDAGDDTIIGAAGFDRLLGGSDDDRLAGGPDGDLLRGGEDNDRMRGKGGVDVIQAKDGFTDLKISCGPGSNRRERAKRDKRLDPRAKSC